MSDAPENIKRWTARRKVAIVMDNILKGKATAPELARSHGLTVAEIGLRLDGTEALRSHPRDVEARHRVERKPRSGAACAS